MADRPTGERRSTPEPPPHFSDIVYLLWKRGWFILLLTVVCAGAGYGLMVVETETFFIKQVEVRSFGLIDEQPNIVEKFRQNLTLDATVDDFQEALAPVAVTPLPAPAGVINVAYDRRTSTFDIGATSADRNVTVYGFPYAHERFMAFLQEECRTLIQRLDAVLQVLNDSMEAKRAELDKLQTQGDPEIALEKVRSLLNVRQNILTESLSASSLNEERLQARLKVIDDQIAAIDMASARRGDSLLSLYIEDYQTTVRDFLEERRRRQNLSDIQRSIEGAAQLFDPDAVPLIEEQRGPGLIQRVGLLGMFGFFMGSVLVLLHVALVSGMERADS